MNRRSKCTLSVVLAGIAMGLAMGEACCQAQITSTWVVSSASSDWFSVPNWNAGIPNAPGDTARLTTSSGSRLTVQLTQTPTVGQLVFVAPGQLVIKGSSLTFDNPGAAMALIQTSVPAGAGRVAAIVSSPLTIATGEQLQIDLAPATTLVINGGISSGSGDVSKTGVGQLTLGAASPSWDGQLDITDGEVVVTSAGGLGTAVGGTTIENNATLTLSAATSETLGLKGGTVATNGITLSSPIQLSGSSSLRNATNASVLSGKISGPGDLALRNDANGAVTISGSNNYSGHTLVTAGAFTASTSTAFGDASQGTTIQGGTVTLQTLTDETFEVDGGTLALAVAAATYSHQVNLNGGTLQLPSVAVNPTQVVVGSANGTVQFFGSSWTGGSSGVGNLQLKGTVKIDALLTHQGDLTVDSAQFDVADSYAGQTYIRGTSLFNHPDGFGSSPMIHVQGGSLTLNTLPRGTPNLVIEGGQLTVPSGVAAYTGPIHYQSSMFSASVITAGTFGGPITGTGELQLGGGTNDVVNLNVANDMQGPVRIRGGTVNVNDPHAITAANTRVESGTLNVNATLTQQVITLGGVLNFGAAQDLSLPWFQNAGTLAASHEVRMSNLLMLGSTATAAVVSPQGGGTFRIGKSLDVLDHGSLDGAITGPGNIRLRGAGLSIDGDMTGFTGNYIAETGSLYFGYLSSGFTGPTSINPHSEMHVYDGATLGFAIGSPPQAWTINNDIFLHNARGANGYQGALITAARLNGRLDSGDQGSTIAGSFQIYGVLTGHNLTVRGFNGGGNLEIHSPQTQFKGVLRAGQNSAIQLEDQGTLSGLDAIELDPLGILGIAAVDNGPQDRIADDVEIKSLGGVISNAAVGYSNVRHLEVLGKLSLLEGKTTLIGYFDSGSPQPTMAITELHREPGTVLRFNTNYVSAGGVKLIQAPTLHDDMIGAWAVTDQGFATLDSNGVVKALPTTINTLNGAAPTDHVYLTGSETMAADTTISSLQSRREDTPLDLGGHRLTITSGGLFDTPSISNGRLTAGVSGNAELVLNQNYSPISADIVDNSAGGSVALVVNDAVTQLSGHNTYSGGTYVDGTDDDIFQPTAEGRLVINSVSAIPVNDRVFLDHAIYDLQHTAGMVTLSELHLRGGSQVRAGSGTPFALQNGYLDDGIFYATLVGGGSIYKQTDGSVDFSNSKSPDYTGTVYVQGGTLLLQYDTTPKAKFVLQGGELDVSGYQGASNDIVLAGGRLGPGTYNGHVDVQSDSEIFHTGNTLLYGKMTGSGNLVIRGSQDNRFAYYVGLFGDASQFAGNIQVESGSLRVGSPSNAGTGKISVMSTGHLILGSNYYTDAPTSLANDIDLFDGTLFSTPPTETSSPNRASPSVVTGKVTVHDEAFIGALSLGKVSGNYVPGLSIAGSLTLLDNSHVYGISSTGFQPFQAFNGDVAAVDISGQLLVGDDTVWHLLTSTLNVSGTIRANSPDASIDFVGLPDLLRFKNADIYVDSGHSLSVMLNEGTVPISVSGAGHSIHGNGELHGNFTVGGGAGFSPGNSPGLLTIDGNANIATDGHLAIELAGRSPGSQYDSLCVTGNVDLNGAILDVTFLDGYVPSSDDAFVILRGANIHGVFANAKKSILIGDTLVPVTYRDRMVILGNPNAVPEPMSVLLAIAALLFGAPLAHTCNK